MVIPPFLAYDQTMRCLAVITFLVLAITIAQPVAAQSFKPDYDAGWDAYSNGDYATVLKHFRPLAKVPPHGENEARLAGESL